MDPGDVQHPPSLRRHRFVEDTAAEKARKVINRLLDWREEQRLLLASSPHLGLGDVATCNLTMLAGGEQVLPPQHPAAIYDPSVTMCAISEQKWAPIFERGEI